MLIHFKNKAIILSSLASLSQQITRSAVFLCESRRPLLMGISKVMS
jgi:hypothetical protein